MNAYTRSYAAAANRNTDQIIINSALAAASTGVDGGDSTSFDTSGYRIAHASVGLTLAKIIGAKKRLVAAENDPMQPWYFAYGSEQLEELLLDPLITSNDYNSVKMLVRGDINTFMGFEWIQTELLTVASEIRSCLAWVRDSLLLGISEDIVGDVGRRRDKNNGLQLLYTMDMGATRMDEVGVVEIQCDES
jgi:hypothetical protein